MPIDIPRASGSTSKRLPDSRRGGLNECCGTCPIARDAFRKVTRRPGTGFVHHGRRKPGGLRRSSRNPTHFRVSIARDVREGARPMTFLLRAALVIGALSYLAMLRNGTDPAAE